jgi:hypothetical protein
MPNLLGKRVEIEGEGIGTIVSANRDFVDVLMDGLSTKIIIARRTTLIKQNFMLKQKTKAALPTGTNVGTQAPTGGNVGGPPSPTPAVGTPAPAPGVEVLWADPKVLKAYLAKRRDLVVQTAVLEMQIKELNDTMVAQRNLLADLIAMISVPAPARRKKGS